MRVPETCASTFPHFQHTRMFALICRYMTGFPKFYVCVWVCPIVPTTKYDSIESGRPEFVAQKSLMALRKTGTDERRDDD